MSAVFSRIPLSTRWLFRRPIDGDPIASGALLLVRVIAGTAMMLHGLPKMADPMSWMGPSGVPGVLQLFAACAETFGGLAWILGAAMPLSALAVGSGRTKPARGTARPRRHRRRAGPSRPASADR